VSRYHRKAKNRLGQFVPLLKDTISTPAWKAMSHGAKSLYISLKGRGSNGHNRAYLPYRQAQDELRATSRKIGEWFRELEHYGFIVLDRRGCLGVDGEGKSPLWRLTELGTTSRTSADGLPEAPTRDFLKWDGVLFERRRETRDRNFLKRKKQNPASHVGSDAHPTSEAPPHPTSEARLRETASDGVDISPAPTASDGVDITSLPLPRNSAGLSGTSSVMGQHGGGASDFG